jgi:hypothetical protein
MPKTTRKKKVVRKKRRNRRALEAKHDVLSENPTSAKAQQEYVAARDKKGTKTLREALER